MGSSKVIELVSDRLNRLAHRNESLPDSCATFAISTDAASPAV